MALTSGRIATRIANLETAQDSMDKSPADLVTIGDKTYRQSADLREQVSNELADLYGQQDALLNVPKGGFSVARIQAPGI